MQRNNRTLFFFDILYYDVFVTFFNILCYDFFWHTILWLFMTFFDILYYDFFSDILYCLFQHTILWLFSAYFFPTKYIMTFFQLVSTYYTFLWLFGHAIIFTRNILFPSSGATGLSIPGRAGSGVSQSLTLTIFMYIYCTYSPLYCLLYFFLDA